MATVHQAFWATLHAAFCSHRRGRPQGYGWDVRRCVGRLGGLTHFVTTWLLVPGDASDAVCPYRFGSRREG